jgi:O-antigen ligase
VGLMVVMAYSALGEVGRLDGRRVEWGREVRWLVVAVLALGLLSTLARNVLVSGAVSFGLLFVALRHGQRVRLAEMLMFIGFLSALLVAGLLVAGEAGSLLRYADLYLERITRMFSADIVAEGENLQPRWLEIQYAWEKLKGSPILGIGLYNPYRPAFYVGEPVQLRHFLHNAYLALWIKTGLPGLLSFLWLSVLFVKRAFENWRRVGDCFAGACNDRGGRLMRAAVLGSVVAFVGLLISNFVAPTFVQPGSLAVFGLIFGINEALFFTVQETKEGGIGDGDEK